MRRVIETAADVARAAGKHRTVFDWWLHAYQGQSAWAGGWGIPPLLAHFGTSLMERAVIDAFCRSRQAPFARIVRENRLGIRLGQLHEELGNAGPLQFFPDSPLRSVVARHTVGLADAIRDSDIAPADRVRDELPQSLEACMRSYGLTYFKIKLSGDVAHDVDRLREIAAVLQNSGGEFRFTLDANENFNEVGAVRELWELLLDDDSLQEFMSELIFVEQPLNRAVALEERVMAELRAWKNRPPIIIDESDGEIGSATKAMAGGYAGTSHKNCKGVIKSIANACLIEHRRRTTGQTLILSGEDLCNVGPVALQQDFTVAATLGLDHVERNGHHYFRGLSMLPGESVEPIVSRHGDLYRRLEDGTPAVKIENGRVAIGSVVDAPFGLAHRFDPVGFTPLKDWDPDTISAA
jgi:hypothetical protein